MWLQVMANKSAGSLLMALLLAHPLLASAASSPCDGVNRGLAAGESNEWAPAIAKQLNVANVDILQLFALGKWKIIYVDTHQSDETFLFYNRDPRTGHYLSLWSGAAAPFEEQEIKGWVLKNVPSIPVPLAGCFAWHVTKSRDM
jgi:hypothetical protein